MPNNLAAYIEMLKEDPEAHTPWSLQRFWPLVGTASAALPSGDEKEADSTDMSLQRTERGWAFTQKERESIREASQIPPRWHSQQAD